jgi:hypothetical protein
MTAIAETRPRDAFMRTLALTLAALLFMSTPAFAQQPAPVVALPLPQWTRLVDPQENAYQVDVPAGWNSTGGTVRYNALQFWQYTTSISPDELTQSCRAM